MPLYETVFLVRQDVSGQAVDDLVEAYKTVITDGGGTVGRTENWGLKTLAYRIEKNRKAHFALMDIDSPPAAVQEMERQMRINEDVLRTLTIKVETHEDGPSVMKQKRDRDDRRRRERGDRREDEDGFDMSAPPRRDDRPGGGFGGGDRDRGFGGGGDRGGFGGERSGGFGGGDRPDRGPRPPRDREF